MRFLRRLARKNPELFDAIARGDITQVRSLPMTKSHVNARNADGNTPLIEAIKKKQMEIIRYLLDNGANLDLSGAYPGPPLLHALFLSPLLDVVRLLVAGGADVRIRNKYGQTPLHMAAGQEDPAYVNLLLERGAEADVRDSRKTARGETPLHVAIMHNNRKTAEKLIQAGADVNLPDKDGNTPMRLAAVFADAGMLELLVEHGADAGLENLIRLAWDSTVFGKPDSLRFVLEHGVVPDLWPDYTLLHLACGCLVWRKISKNPAAARRKDPFPANAVPGYADVVRVLLQHGASPNARDSLGKQPADYAVAILNSARVLPVPEAEQEKIRGAFAQILTALGVSQMSPGRSEASLARGPEKITAVQRRSERAKERGSSTPKGIREVRILAEPYGDVAKTTWGSIRIIPPDNLLAQADHALGLDGALVAFAQRKPPTVTKVQTMSDSEMDAYIQSQIGWKHWSIFFARTDMVKYNVVVHWEI